MRYLLILTFLGALNVMGQVNDSTAVLNDFSWTKYEENKNNLTPVNDTVSVDTTTQSSPNPNAITVVDTTNIDTTHIVIEPIPTIDTLVVDFNSNNYDEEAAIPFSNSALTANCSNQVKDRVRDFYELDLVDCEFDKKMATCGSSIMAVFDIEKFVFEGDSVILRITQPIGEKMNLCSTERFYHQPSEAIGTAFLCDSTHVLTAYHCVKNLPVERLVLVTGYTYLYYSKNLEVKLHKSSIYKIKKLAFSTTSLDYVNIEVDRKITDRTLPRFDTTGLQFSQAKIFTIGYPLGMPLKAISNGVVVKPFDASHYLISIDAYRGNSGSPIFNIETGNIIGMLIGGDADIEKNGSCYTLKNCLVKSCNREVMIDIRKILNEINKKEN